MFEISLFYNFWKMFIEKWIYQMSLKLVINCKNLIKSRLDKILVCFVIRNTRQNSERFNIAIILQPGNGTKIWLKVGKNLINS